MDPKLLEIQKLLDAADGNLSSARTMIREMAGSDAAPLDIDAKLENMTTASEGSVVEGVFDGEMMIAPDGQTYPVPPNYASKSKLVEGDTLKLTIAADGSFVFKQIAPVERRNAVGTLAQNGSEYTISAEGKTYKVLTASVTFYKATPGDQVTIVLPKDHDAIWAVMENVIPKPDIQADVLPAANIVPTVEAEEPMETTEKVIPEPTKPPVDAAETTPDLAEGNIKPEASTPEIVFPGGTPTVSDEQLLENLKNNLKTLEQPAYTSPEVASAPAAIKPVDNIVANDLAALGGQPTTPPIAAPDKPIAELDI